MGSALYYGDNLDVLREHVDDASVDLIYLDPPFNSNARYNVLFKAPDGEPSSAQAEAFHDTWHWTDQAESAYDDVMSQGGASAEILRALRSFLGDGDMMAYLANMCVRLSKMRSALKPTGSLYLHCDPHASHYLKIVLDGIFGHGNFRNEIIWKRTPFAGSSKSRSRQLPRNHDVILFYTASDTWTWNAPTVPYSEKYLERFKWTDKRGAYRKTLLKTYSEQTLERLRSEDRLILPTKAGANYSYKQYLKESRGSTQVDDVWTDINMINPVAKERIGYPTQKPLALLRRIINSSSNPGDLVLDPFCGCGTTVQAAQELKRDWIGIDIAHYAVGVIESRLKQEFGNKVRFAVDGRPTTIDGARALARRDKYQFQWWANWLVGVQNYREHKKGADRGIDGIIFFRNGPFGTGRVIVSVKGGETVNPDMVRALAGTVDREKAELGLLVCLADPSSRMKQETSGLGICKTAHGKFPKVQIVTVEDLLDGKKLNLPPRYEIQPQEQIPRRDRGKERHPQLGFTFGIRGEKKDNIVTYPAEAYATQQAKAG